MPHTNIDVYAIEELLPAAALNKRELLIEEAVKRINIWLTPEPNKVEIINIITYKSYDMEQKFSLDITEQRKLIEKMFDDNMSLVFIQKTSESVIKSKGLFSSPKHSIVTTESRNYLFTKLAMDIKRDIDLIKGILVALRNPRVVLSVKEHYELVYYLSKYNINLFDFYI